MVSGIKCSVIVPNYNHAVYLEKRMQTILNQSFKNFEVILLDDSSTDTSIDILKEYAVHPKVSHLLLNEKNSGSPFKQWQKGIAVAKGEYIWIAESDDYCQHDFLEKIFEFKKASGRNPSLIYSQSQDVDNKGRIISHRIEYTSEFESNIWKDNFVLSNDLFTLRYLKIKNVIPNASAVIFKRSLVDEFTFSENLLKMKMCGDWLFWIKISRNIEVGFVAEPLNYFRNHSGSTRNHDLKEKKIRRLLEEAVIRKYLEKNFPVEQERETWDMYYKWFNLFPLKALGKRLFYTLPIKNRHYIPFLKKFIFKKANAR